MLIPTNRKKEARIGNSQGKMTSCCDNCSSGFMLVILPADFYTFDSVPKKSLGLFSEGVVDLAFILKHFNR